MEKIKAQIKIMEQKLEKGKNKNKFALQNKILQLKKQLSKLKQFNWLAQ